MVNSLLGIVQRHLLPAYEKLTLDSGSIALSEDRHHQLCTAGTLQTGEPDDLALVDMEGDVVIHNFLRIERMVNGPVLHFQRDFL